MLVSAPYPPLPIGQSGLDHTGRLCELCKQEPLGDLGFAFDPGMVTIPLGIGASIFQTMAAKDIAKKQAKLEAAALKAQRENNAREFAMAQAQMQALPAEQNRLMQTYALYAIGGVAVVVSGIFFIAAIRAGK